MTGQTGHINTDNEAVAQVTWSDGQRGAGTRHTDGTMYPSNMTGQKGRFLTRCRQTGHENNDGTDGTGASC